MADARNERNVQLDLNNEVFQENWLGLDKQERNRVTDTLKKPRHLTLEPGVSRSGPEVGESLEYQSPQRHGRDLHAAHYAIAAGHGYRDGNSCGC